MNSREELLKKLQLCVDDPMWADHVEMPKRLLRIVIEQLNGHAHRPLPTIEFEYCNWEGRKSLRQARPISIRFGKSEWHPKPQWLMLAFDTDRGAEREFAMDDMTFENGALASLAFSTVTSTVRSPIENKEDSAS